MTTYSFLRRVLRLAVIALAAGVLAAGPALLPAVRLQASTSAAADPAAPASPAAGAGLIADEGVIAYVKHSTGDIYLINSDGSNNRLLWTNPQPTDIPIDLEWRHDGLELAFSSRHESTCSFYDSDIYAIRSDGTGLRRVTNAPTCAELAPLPKGGLTVVVTNYTGDPSASVYVAGTPGIKKATSGTVTFDNVADFGPDIVQPAVGIVGLDRVRPYAPFADVIEGQTLPGGIVTIQESTKIRSFGAGSLSWKADNTKIAYVWGVCLEIDNIAANPGYGRQGNALPVVTGTFPCIVDWNPTPAGKEEYLYYSSIVSDETYGIYRYTPTGPPGGTRLIDPSFWEYGIHGLAWLPDGSGFLWSQRFMASWDFKTCGGDPYGSCTNIFRYDLATGHVTQLSDFSDQLIHGLSVSSDGQSIIFERWTDPDLDVGSDLWVMNADGSNPHRFLRDAARPSWFGPGGNPVAMAPLVTIDMDPIGIYLNWDDLEINVGGYKVRYSEKPYFQVGDAGVTTIDLEPGTEGWVHHDAAGDPAHNYYYFVQGVGAGGATSGPSNRTGGFNFGLTPGS